MHYVGTLLSGAKFDSSRDRGSPFQTRIGPSCGDSGTARALTSFRCTTGVGQVIRGWDEGVPQLSLGEKVRCSGEGEVRRADAGHRRRRSRARPTLRTEARLSVVVSPFSWDL